MSSEQFESFENEFENLARSIKRKINSQLPNYTGEQRKVCIRQATKEVERATQLLSQMDMESRSAPMQYRNKQTSRIRNYREDLEQFQSSLKQAEASGGGGGGGQSNDQRDELFGQNSYQSAQINQRSRLLDNDDILNRTSDRISNAKRIGEESEAIGAGVLEELADQRETIIRTGQKVGNIDGNLGKSKRILNAMARRIMTNHLVMMLIIFVLCGILGLVCYLKFKK
eukprot:m.35757 g.35757  ORF g.35757 m.35757 type:complete len:228 (-) comp17198_c0_seq1:282-965(-)